MLSLRSESIPLAEHTQWSKPQTRERYCVRISWDQKKNMPGANQAQNTRGARSRYMSIVLRYVAQDNDLQGAKDFAAKIAQAFKDLKENEEEFHSIKFIGQLEKGLNAGKFHIQMFFYHGGKPRHAPLRTKLYDHLMDYVPGWPATAVSVSGKSNPQMIGIQPSDARRCEALKKYAMKDDETTIAGTMFHWNPDRYNGEDLEPITANPLTWQRKLLEVLNAPPNRRHIYWIYDDLGKSGKSILYKYVLWQGGAWPLSHGSAQQLCTSALEAMDNHPKPITKWLIDAPRTKCTKNSDTSMYNFIESLKNGVLTSAMYGKARLKIFRSPHVVVFSNSLPQLSAMTGDRWMVYQLQTRTGPRGPFAQAQATVGDITGDIDMVRLAREDIIRMSQRVTPPAQVAPPPPRSYPNSDGITAHYDYPESQEVNCTPLEMVPETDSEMDDFAAADDSDDLPDRNEYGYENYGMARSPSVRPRKRHR